MDFGPVCKSRRFNLQLDRGVAGLAALDCDGHALGKNINIGLVIDNGGRNDFRRRGPAIELIVLVFADHRRLVLQHGDLCGQKLDAADGDEDLLLHPSGGDGDLGCAGGLAIDVRHMAVFLLGYPGHVLIPAFPDHPQVLRGGVAGLPADLNADALVRGGVGLQGEGIICLAHIPGVTDKLQVRNRAGGQRVRSAGFLFIAGRALVRIFSQQGCGSQGEDHDQGKQQRQQPPFGGDFHENAPFRVFFGWGNGSGRMPAPVGGQKIGMVGVLPPIVPPLSEGFTSVNTIFLVSVFPPTVRVIVTVAVLSDALTFGTR